MEKKLNSCMQKIKDDIEKRKRFYGPSNRDLMEEIIKLQEQVQLLTEILKNGNR